MEDETIERLLDYGILMFFFLPRRIKRVTKLQNCSNKFDKNFSYLILYDTYYMTRWNGIT